MRRRGARSPLYNNPKYRCKWLCNAHVEKLAFIGAIICSVSVILVAIGKTLSNWWNALILVEILFFLSILLAQRVRLPFLYLPFLIFGGLVIVLLILHWLVVIAEIVVSLFENKNVIDGISASEEYNFTTFFEGNQTTTNTASDHFERVVTLVSVGLTLLSSALFFVYYWIVIRAFGYMRDEKSLHKHKPKTNVVAPKQGQQQQKPPTPFYKPQVIVISDQDPIQSR